MRFFTLPVLYLYAYLCMFISFLCIFYVYLYIPILKTLAETPSGHICNGTVQLPNLSEENSIDEIDVRIYRNNIF